MNLANITAESLSKELEEEVSEIYVVIAKHDLMGTDDESLCEMIGVPLADLEELKSTPLYEQIRTHIGAIAAQSHASRVYGWDGLESMALDKLATRMEYENDSEFLLKVAALANKAQRRGGGNMGVLDPSKVNRTSVVLTERLVQRFQGGGSTEQVRELSIHDGSMERVSFDDVNKMLQIRNETPIPGGHKPVTRDPTAADLTSEMDI